MVTKFLTFLQVAKTRVQLLRRSTGQASTGSAEPGVLLGLQTFYRVRGEAHKALEVAEQGFHLAQRAVTPTALLTGHAGLVEPLLDLGEFTTAREHLEQALARYQPQKHDVYVSEIRADPGVVLLSHLATILWYLGCPDQAQQKCDESLALADKLSHLFSLAFALSTASWFLVINQEWQHARERAEGIIRVAIEQGFPFWLALGTVKRVRVLVELGQVEEGIARLQQGMAAYRASRQAAPRADHLPWLATAYARMGRVE